MSGLMLIIMELIKINPLIGKTILYQYWGKFRNCPGSTYIKPLEHSKDSSRMAKDVNYVVDKNVVARSNYNAKDEGATGGRPQQQEAQHVYQ